MAQTDTNTTQQTENEKLFEQAVNSAYDLADKADEYKKLASAPPTQYERSNLLRAVIERNKKTQPTEEEMKREYNKRRYAAVADGLIALSNMAGAIGGATPLQQHKTLTEGQKTRFEEALKMRNGYRTRQERNAEETMAMQQDRMEENRIKQLQLQEAKEKADYRKLEQVYRDKHQKAVADLHKRAEELGVKRELADSLMKYRQDKLELDKKKTNAQVANIHDQIGKREDKSQGTTVVTTTTDEHGQRKKSEKVATPNANKTPAKKHRDARRGKR